MIRINCFIQTTPATRDMVVADAVLLTEHSRNEEGCVAYDIFSSQTCPEVLMICETWATQEALDAHQKTETFRKYVGHMRELAQFKTERFEF